MKTPFQSKIAALSFFICLLAASASKVQAQAPPTDNVYRTYYFNEVPAAHWTDSLPWGRVFNIQDYASSIIVVDDSSLNQNVFKRQSWLPAFQAAQAAAVAAGGGTIYFPRLPQKTDDESGDAGKDSSYFFHDDIKLKSNIILRGQDLTVQNSRVNYFVPPTFFEFPQYRFLRRVGVSGGVINTSAFKQITIDTTGATGVGRLGVHNVGIVNIDVLRGRIAAHPTFRAVTVGSENTFWPAENLRNFLVMGIRSNNVAIPDPAVPASTQSDKWFRWSWRFASNIDLFVQANAIVANCRLNDSHDFREQNIYPTRPRAIDDFDQTNYQVGNSGPNCVFTDGARAKFNYANHYGISINRFKFVNYTTGPKGFLNDAGPEKEPSHYATGNVVRDNWVYKTSRAGIIAGGLGLKVTGNVIRDDSSKSYFVTQTGTGCQVSNTSAENTGIDFTGWDVLIENNDIQYFRALYTIPDAYSIDGNGFYAQGPSGSTFKNIVIRNNILRSSAKGLCNVLTNNSGQGKGISGFFNTNFVENVLIENNQMGGTRLAINANLGGGGIASNVVVRNNTDVRGVEVSGVFGGQQCFVYNNTATSRDLGNQSGCNFRVNSGNELVFSCQVCINPDVALCNTNTNTGLTPPLNCQSSSTGPTICGLPTTENFPVTRMVSPASDISIGLGPDGVARLTAVGNARMSGDSLGCTFDNDGSVKMYLNAVEVLGLVPNGTFYEAPLTFTAPGVYSVNIVATKRTSSNTFVASSTSVTVRINILGTRSRSTFDGQVNVFPNPTTGNSTVQIQSARKGNCTITLTDIAGKVLGTSTFKKTTTILNHSLPLGSLAKGTYLVSVSDETGTIVQRVSKQ